MKNNLKNYNKLLNAREEYKRKDATHNLACSHCISPNRMEYYMDCIVLKDMPNNRLKILVFGDRYWKGHDDKKRVKYVDSYRVTSKVGSE